MDLSRNINIDGNNKRSDIRAKNIANEIRSPKYIIVLMLASRRTRYPEIIIMLVTIICHNN